MSEKKIAVFIPCYNAAETIGETLVSIKKSIQYIAMDVPVYIYDDGSKDESLSIARTVWGEESGLNIRKNERNLGERQTTNNAFEYFYNRYDWVFIIHADDIAKLNWLSAMYEQICSVDNQVFFSVWSSFDSLDNASGKIIEGDNSGTVSIRSSDRQDIIDYITKLYSSWHISGAAFNVRLYHELKGFDISMAQFGDTDFFVRGLLAGYLDIYISQTLSFYRTFQNSVSAISSKTNRDIREIYMLMDKYNSILSKSDMNKLQKIILRLSSRRMIKGLLAGKLKTSADNFAIFFRTALKLFILNPGR